MGRALRADAERSVRVILEAAEQVLAQDPNASMEQIAETAGLARTTVHRRFTSRQALLDALAEAAQRQLTAAVDDAHPETAPATVVLHRVTSNVIRVKSAMRFTLSNTVSNSSVAAELWARTDQRCLDMLRRAQDEGLLDPSTNLHWTRQVYYALVGEALHRSDLNGPENDPDALATLVVTTLLHGGGPRT
jgi:AcrR family transcriptional regulator